MQRAHIDQMTFVEYLDDGDYFQILARKGDSIFSFINDIEDNRNINRGDLVQVRWKRDSITVPGDNDSKMPADILLDLKKAADGPVSRFRKTYGRKLKYTWATNEEFTSSYLDKVYLIVEYYLTQTTNPLLRLAVNSKDELTYSIESKTRDDRDYTVIGIAPVGPNGASIVQWLYVDEESDKLYEYNLPEDKLIAFD
ncbi:hypothetical protein [Mucilaginibacter sp. KACC 22063]|uniref:hypothetical protein n=1 Tax=Mucilaginibacter sp. KACC 22063 TaxID=3025666 RepID=UPI002366599D|nr:hypothetical protein [Mucilaginibacter sp. KACC 22063]WDF57194.1 hypothetical protein PQ461_09020 [Mucilaginibacter sp. KACC 22063]